MWEKGDAITERVLGLDKARANYGPGDKYGPLSFLIWPTELEEIMVIVSK